MIEPLRTWEQSVGDWGGLGHVSASQGDLEVLRHKINELVDAVNVPEPPLATQQRLDAELPPPDPTTRSSPGASRWHGFVLHIFGQLDGEPFDNEWVFATGADEMTIHADKTLDLTIRRTG